MWHTNIGFAEPGCPHEVYPTRNHFTGSGELSEVADLTQEQHLQAAAVHELGHLVVNWGLGAHVRAVSITDCGYSNIEGNVDFVYPLDSNPRAPLIGGAAGERACDRWFREEGLWTPARAVFAEVVARSDRQSALAEDPSITFDGGPNDYHLLQDAADRALDRRWFVIRRGLPHFTRPLHMTGDEACELLGIQNHPAI